MAQWIGGSYKVAAVPDSDVSEYRLYANGVLLATAPPATPEVVFSNLEIAEDGVYNLTATTKDLADLESGHSAPRIIRLDHIAPGTPGTPELVSSFSYNPGG